MYSTTWCSWRRVSSRSVVVSSNVYGGTYRLFVHILEQFGLKFTFVDTSDLSAVAGAIRPETRLVYVETPTNPMMEIADLEGVAGLCREHDLISVCDNTFMSPYLQ